MLCDFIAVIGSALIPAENSRRDKSHQTLLPHSWHWKQFKLGLLFGSQTTVWQYAFISELHALL